MSNWLILVIVIITACLIDCIVKNITDTIKTKYEKKIKITIQHQNSDKNCMMIESVVDFFNHRHYYTYDSINVATDKDKLHLRRMGLLDDSLLSADKIKTGNFVIVEPIHNVIRVLDKYNDSFAAYTWDSRKDIVK